MYQEISRKAFGRHFDGLISIHLFAGKLSAKGALLQQLVARTVVLLVRVPVRDEDLFEVPCWSLARVVMLHLNLLHGAHVEDPTLDEVCTEK